MIELLKEAKQTREKRLNEEKWQRYKELHAGRSILLDAEKSLRTARRAPWESQHKFPQHWWATCLTLQRRREEIEREIKEKNNDPSPRCAHGIPRKECGGDE